MNPFITIYILAWNEELLLPFTINWYRIRFPNCRIVVYDNFSTDKTAEIARNFNCEVIQFDTADKISDTMYLTIKNSCWRSATTPWVCIVDADELIGIDEHCLSLEDQWARTIIRAEGWNMINLNNDLNINTITHGFRDERTAKFYDKAVIFKKTMVQSINYIPGAHAHTATGEVYPSKELYRLYHFAYLSPDYMVERYTQYRERLSDQNKQNGWGGQYNETEATIRTQFEQYRAQAIKLL